jgi:hypothetical protein
MMKPYRYKIDGAASDGQSFQASGSIYCEFHETFNAAMADTFMQLTNGKALYGKPGIGCRGPYDILKISIEQVKQ